MVGGVDDLGRLRQSARTFAETVTHNRERTSAFVERYGDRLVRTIDREVAYEWLADGNRWTIPALRAMFNDAERAGKIDRPPFNGLGLAVPTRVGRRLPARADVDRMHSLADELTPPSFSAYLFTVGWQGIRPGEGDALRWDRLDFDAGTMVIDQQWSAKGRRFKEPKHGSTRKLPMVPVVRDRLAALPRESEFVFTTTRDTHYTPSSRAPLGMGAVRARARRRPALPRDAALLRDVRDRGARALGRGRRCVLPAPSRGAQIVHDHYLHPDDDRRRARISLSVQADCGSRTRATWLEGEAATGCADKRARRLHSVEALDTLETPTAPQSPAGKGIEPVSPMPQKPRKCEVAKLTRPRGERLVGRHDVEHTADAGSMRAVSIDPICPETLMSL